MIVIMELNRNFCGTFFGGLKEAKKKDAKSSLQAFGCFFLFFYFYYYYFFYQAARFKTSSR